MALMFQRLAHNFANNGYYPTDAKTLSGILSALSPCSNGQMRILDPCAGEGAALAECTQHLGVQCTEAFGIEYDEERAWHAKSLLDRCIHADLQQCVFSKKSFGLLFLNPPYGDLVADKTLSSPDGAEQSVFVQQGRKRLEKLFYQLTMPSLQLGGILVFIIPAYSLDNELAHWISHHFDRVEVFKAPEQRFKQIVLFGVRCPSDGITNIKQTKDKLLQLIENPHYTELPSVWTAEPYRVPAVLQPEVRFFTAHLEPKQLAAEISQQPGLWSQFRQRFGNTVTVPKNPLMPLSEWHLALSLAAGQVSGVVDADDGRCFIIRGDTHKEAMVTQYYEEDDKGNFTEVRTHLDKFVPVIRALDMTPESLTFGEVLTIR